MKFEARELTETADISRGEISPRQIVRYSLTVGVLLVICYVILGWVAEAIAVRIPPGVERRLAFIGGIYTKDADGFEDESRKAQEVLNRLLAVAELPEFDYHIVVMDEESPNAMALPGGTIVVTSGLFDTVESEEELAMVLGHELGHFKQRDHMRGLGRGVLLSVTVGIVFGGNILEDIVMSGIDVGERSHSRKAESGADALGLEWLVAAYGHAGGATGFFESLRELHGEGRLIRYFLSHPVPGDRVEALEARIDEIGAEVRDTKPLNLGGDSKNDDADTDAN